MSAVDIKNEKGFTSTSVDFREFIDDQESKGDLLRVPFEVDTLDDMLFRTILFWLHSHGGAFHLPRGLPRSVGRKSMPLSLPPGYSTAAPCR